MLFLEGPNYGKVRLDGEKIEMNRNTAVNGQNIFLTWTSLAAENFSPLPHMSTNSHNGQKYHEQVKKKTLIAN